MFIQMRIIILTMVQIHVRDSKKRFDKLAVDVLQKIDLLAASRLIFSSGRCVSTA